MMMMIRQWLGDWQAGVVDNDKLMFVIGIVPLIQ